MALHHSFCLIKISAGLCLRGFPRACVGTCKAQALPLGSERLPQCLQFGLSAGPAVLLAQHLVCRRGELCFHLGADEGDALGEEDMQQGAGNATAGLGNGD